MRDLVLLPGWGMTPAVFAPLLPLLTPHCRVHALPLPTADNIDDMAAALLAAAPAPAAWFGWSLGGMVAAQAALREPARVEALVTLGSNLKFVADADWPQAMPATEYAAFAAAVGADAVAALGRFQVLATRGSRSAREDLRRLRELLAPMAAAAEPVEPETAQSRSRLSSRLAYTLEALAGADLRASLAGLRCPSLWLYGEHDALVPASVASVVSRDVPGATTRIMAGASHTPFLAAPDTVAADILGFLAEHA